MKYFFSLADAEARIFECLHLYQDAHGSRPEVVQLSYLVFGLIVDSEHFDFGNGDGVFFFAGLRIEIDEESDDLTITVLHEPALLPREVSAPPTQAATGAAADPPPPPKYKRQWMQLFLDLYAYTGHMDRSAEILHVKRSNVFYQVKNCPAFAEAFAQVQAKRAEYLWQSNKHRGVIMDC